MVERTMLSLFFAAATAVHVLMLLITLRLRAGAAEWIVRIMVLGLIWDNTILAISPIAFEESWYRGASWLRYFVHVVFLPPLAFAALVVARRAGVKWAARNAAIWSCLLFVAAAVVFGLVTEIIDLALVRETLFGHDRYVSADASPPLATIAVNLLVLFLSAAIWRKAAWPWLLAASVFILLVNGLSVGNDWSILAGNLAEIVFLAGWVVSLYRFRASAD
ncbi:MAG: hypothetical protein ACR2RD_07825 [Woeseiaceae bacterium]